MEKRTKTSCNHDFEDSVGYWICMASRAFERAMNDELAPRGITYRQAQVLWLLAHEGNLSQTDLAERMRIEPPTLVGILDRMEREGGFVAKATPTTDVASWSRRWPRPSRSGRRSLIAANRVRARGNQGLSREEQQLLKTLLGRIVVNLVGRKRSDGGVT